MTLQKNGRFVGGIHNAGLEHTSTGFELAADFGGIPFPACLSLSNADRRAFPHP